MVRTVRMLLTAAVLAQPALAHWLDLPGDDARWARPEFDDRHRNQMPERFLLLRTVTAPAPEAELASTMAGVLDGGFVTAVVVRGEAGGRVRVPSAGHPAPWVDGQTVLAPGLPLGVVVVASLNQSLVGRVSGGFVTCGCARFDADGTVTVANAGHLAPYADGRAVEGENSRREPFGFDRTRAISTKSAQETAAAAKASGQNDITVVTVRRAQ